MLGMDGYRGMDVVGTDAVRERSSIASPAADREAPVNHGSKGTYDQM